MAGRRSKYTPELVQRIVNALEAGATRKDACAYADISHTTLNIWLNEKPLFLATVTRAEGQARFHATLAIKNAVKGTEQTTTHNETVTETRLRKVKTIEGIIEQPYEYTRTVRGTTVIKFPPDWRAAIEYLKRRDPEHWSDRLNVKQEDWRTEVLKLVQEGKLTHEQVLEELGSGLAEELFASAGIRAIISGEGTASSE